MRLLAGLWPLWVWLAARFAFGMAGEGHEYYRSAYTIGPLLVFAIHRAGSDPRMPPGSTGVWLALCSVVSGLFGFCDEFNRWERYFGNPDYPLGFILQFVDYTLVITSLVSIVIPVAMTPRRNWLLLFSNAGRGRGASSSNADTVHGSAHWMPMRDAQEIFSSGNIIVGEAYVPSENPSPGGRAPLLRFDGSGHILTVSGSGGGKTTSVAIPNCLSWKGSLVVHDPKAELAEKCADARRSMGNGRRVAVLNSADPQTDSINVLDWLDPGSDSVIENAKAVAAWLGSGEEAKGGDAYFQNEAAKLLQCLILFVVSHPEYVSEERNLLTVRNFAASPKLPKILKDIHENERDLCFGIPAKIAGEFAAMADHAPAQWSGVLGSVSVMINWIDTSSLARIVCGTGSGDRHSVRDINDGDLDVFICIPLKTLDSTPGVTRLLLGSLLNARYELGATGKPCAENILFLVDEMPRLRRMEVLETARDAGRGYGITLWAIVQDLGQLQKYYEESGLTSWKESSKLKTFFGIGDEKTAKMLSEMLGEATVEFETISVSVGDSGKMTDIFKNKSRSYSTSRNKTARALMTPDEIMRMSADANGTPDEQLVFLRGQPPLRCGMAKWYRRQEWREILE